MENSKPKAAEIVVLDRTERIAELKRMVDSIRDELAAESMEGENDPILEPWFQPRAVAYEIKRRQTIIQRNKFTWLFEEDGCWKCERRDRPHYAKSMCQRCHNRLKERLKAVVRKHTPALEDATQPSFSDTLRLAREALAPSIPALASHGRRGKTKS